MMRKLFFVALLLFTQFAQAECAKPDCVTAQENTATTTATTANTPNAENLIKLLSVYSAEHNLLYIPQVGIPNASGQFDIYAVALQLTSVNPVQFQLAAAEPVTTPLNGLSAVFSTQDQFLFVPILAANLGGDNIIPIYELVLKVTSTAPFTLGEYTPLQQTQPTSAQTSPAMNDPALYNMMSQFSQMSHDTSMSIIANMDGTSCYGYDYQCQ